MRHYRSTTCTHLLAQEAKNGKVSSSPDQTRNRFLQCQLIEPSNMSAEQRDDTSDPKERSCQDGIDVVDGAVPTDRRTSDSKQSEDSAQRSRLI